MTKKEQLYIYDNVGDFVEWLRKTPQTKKGAERNLSHGRRESFYKTESFEAAQELLENGDANLSRMIIDNVRDIKAKAKSGHMRTNGIVSGPQGFVPNIGAYMTGHPNNMVNIRQTFKPMSKVLSFLYDITVCDSIMTNQMVSAAAKVACVISTLEAKGYRVNLYIGSGARNIHSKSKKNCAKFILKLKDAGKPLDPLRIAYPLTHPSMLRRHAIAFYERAEYVLDKHSYGCVSAVTEYEANPAIGDCVCLSAQNIISTDNSVEAIVRQVERKTNKS